MTSRLRKSFLWPEGLVWLALLALFLTSWWMAYVPIGIWKTMASIAIAVIKTSLVAALFMHLARSEAIVRLAAASGLAWLSILFILSWADYLTR